MTTSATSFECKLPQEPLPVPSMDDIGPVPFLSGDSESFVVIMNAGDLDDNEIADVSLIRDHKQLIQEELAQLESSKTDVQSSSTEGVGENGVASTTDGQGQDIVDNAISPIPPEPQLNGVDNNDYDKAISILSFPPSDFTSEEIHLKVDQLVEENIQLKSTIAKNNESMKEQCKQIIAYKERVDKVHEDHIQQFAKAKKYIEALKQENATLKQEVDGLRTALERQRTEHDETKRLLTETSDGNMKELELDVATGKIKDLERALQQMTLKNERDDDEKAALQEKLERYEKELENAYKKISELEKRRLDIDYEEQANKYKLTEEKLLLSEMANDRLNQEIHSLRTQLARQVQTAEDANKLLATVNQLTIERDQLAMEVQSKNATIMDVQSRSLTLEESFQQANAHLTQTQLALKDLKEKEEQARIEAWRNKQKIIELEEKCQKPAETVVRPPYVPEISAGELAYLRNQLMESQKALTEAHQTRAVAEATAQTLRNEMAQLRSDMEKRQTASDDEFALRTQLDVYKSDFEAERNAKQEILQEKNKVAEDLQHLHRRNLQMQEEIESLRGRLTAAGVSLPPSSYQHPLERNRTQQQHSPSSSTTNSGSYIYKCPRCNFGFTSLTAVENHVMRCIDLDDHLP